VIYSSRDSRFFAASKSKPTRGLPAARFIYTSRPAHFRARFPWELARSGGSNPRYAIGSLNACELHAVALSPQANDSSAQGEMDSESGNPTLSSIAKDIFGDNRISLTQTLSIKAVSSHDVLFIFLSSGG